jgi:plastocyanin
MIPNANRATATTPSPSGLLVLLALTLLLGFGCGGGTETEEPDTPAAEAPTAEAPAAPAGTARIAGHVVYEGEVPALEPIRMDAEPACAEKHSEPVQPEVLVLGDDGSSLGNVFVRVTSGLPEGTSPAPDEPVVIDQEGCQYIPHVVGVMAGQPLQFENSDGILHNVHALPEVNREFNMAMPAERTTAQQTFSRPEDMFRVKCDVHPWMNAWVAVMSHPYFDTTAPDGTFEITGLPAGTYELEAWHEKLGTRTATVTVEDGEAAAADFTFAK